MPENRGTRVRQNFARERIQQGSINGGYSRDVGLVKNVSASITFSASSSELQAADGTFASTFAAGDDLMVEGASLNNGFFRVTGLDATNSAYLVVDPPPKDEGPITVTVRTP
jgi:hypothetical protein